MASLHEHQGSQQRPSSGVPSIYRIRPLQPIDLDGISRVHWRACRTAYRFMSWSYTEDEVRRWYAGKLEEWYWGQVVCAQDTIVAYLAANGAHIDQLFVDPDYQRAGLGRALLTAMLERHLRPATLHVHAENGPARTFYERFGFREVDAGGMRRIRRSTSFTGSNSGPGPRTIRCPGQRHTPDLGNEICCETPGR